MEERIELRSASGALVGVLVRVAQRLEIKRGHRVFEVDLLALVTGTPVVFERVLHPEGNDICTRMNAD